MTPIDDAALLSRCRSGEAAAWEDLFESHYAPTFRFVAQLGTDFSPEDVEEICQETFLNVIRSIDRFDGRSRFQTWLFRVAANKARDFRERQNAAKRGGGQVPASLNAEDPITGLTLDPPDQAPPPDQSLLSLERMTAIRQALDQLGAPCQEIIELRYFADLSYEEIADALSLNVKTVSSRLSKCLDRLESAVRPLLSQG